MHPVTRPGQVVAGAATLAAADASRAASLSSASRWAASATVALSSTKSVQEVGVPLHGSASYSERAPAADAVAHRRGLASSDSDASQLPASDAAVHANTTAVRAAPIEHADDSTYVAIAGRGHGLVLRPDSVAAPVVEAAAADAHDERLLQAVARFKFNSTSSILTCRSTLSLPQPRELLLSVATVLHCQLLSDDAYTSEHGDTYSHIPVGDSVPGNLFTESVILRYHPAKHQCQQAHSISRSRSYDRDIAAEAAPAVAQMAPSASGGDLTDLLRLQDGADPRAPVPGAFMPSLRSLPEPVRTQLGVDAASVAPLVDAAATRAGPSSLDSKDAAPSASTEAAATSASTAFPGSQEFLYQLYMAQALVLATRQGRHSVSSQGPEESSPDSDDEVQTAPVKSSASFARAAPALPGSLVSAPATRPRLALVRTPTLEEVYDFLAALFTTARFSPQCAVIGVIYINRLVASKGVILHAGNWRPLTLVALLCAQKVWDDKALNATDFAVICPLFSPAQIQRLERELLALLDFRLSVSAAMYARYYFELRALSEDVVGMGAPRTSPAGARTEVAQPLSALEARRLEIRSARGLALPSLASLRHGRGGDGRSRGHRGHEDAHGSAFASFSEGMPVPAPSQSIDELTDPWTQREAEHAAARTRVRGGSRDHESTHTARGLPRSSPRRALDLESATYVASPASSRFVIS